MLRSNKVSAEVFRKCKECGHQACAHKDDVGQCGAMVPREKAPPNPLSVAWNPSLHACPCKAVK